MPSLQATGQSPSPIPPRLGRRRFMRKPGRGEQFWTDGWDGYPVARRRLLEYLGKRKPANPVVIGGDVHTFWVADLKPDFDDPRSPVVATEFVGASITSPASTRLARAEAMLADNAHIRFVNVTRRGYVRMEATREREDLLPAVDGGVVHL